MNWLLNRLKEKSTWLGIATMLAAAGLRLSPEMNDALVQTGLALVGLFGVVMTEKKK